MNRPRDLLSIGVFANMTRLSIKALRLYDQLDLFEMAEPPREVWYTGPGPDAMWEIVWLFK
ncbi:MAG TPA: hypothetical protein VI451_00860 [Anaerolineales bacterium]|nr:hypothetical protein [Anaerolineales bacterium]